MSKTSNKQQLAHNDLNLSQNSQPNNDMDIEDDEIASKKLQFDMDMNNDYIEEEYVNDDDNLND